MSHSYPRSAAAILARALRLFACGERGAVAVIAAFSMVAITGMAGFVIDVGHVMWVQRNLQLQADAAALAGAQNINDGLGDAISVATAYSGVNAGANAVNNIPATMAPYSGAAVAESATCSPGPACYPVLRCFSSLLVTGQTACTGSDSANGIQVRETAKIPSYFAQIAGISTWVVTAEATASASTGNPKPLNIMMILDTTDSMSDPDSNCSGDTQIACAQQGLTTLLAEMYPSSQTIGLEVFPAIPATADADNTTCNGKTPSPVGYDTLAPSGDQFIPTGATLTVGKSIVSASANAIDYETLPLSNDFKTSNSSALDTTSSWGITTGQDKGTGCNGVKVTGGEGTFFADAITEAQARLVTEGQPDASNVIILLSDGNAPGSGHARPTGEDNYQCNEAVGAAAAAKAAGTQIYVIGYGSPTSGCSTDASIPAGTKSTTLYPGTSYAYVQGITPCQTLSAISSGTAYFYSDDVNGCASSNNITKINQIFAAIGLQLSSPRLYPNNLT